MSAAGGEIVATKYRGRVEHPLAINVDAANITADLPQYISRAFSLSFVKLTPDYGFFLARYGLQYGQSELDRNSIKQKHAMQISAFLHHSFCRIASSAAQKLLAAQVRSMDFGIGFDINICEFQ